MKVYPPTTHMTFSCTTAFWEALASDVPKGLTFGITQKDSVEGTVSEQSGPARQRPETSFSPRRTTKARRECHPSSPHDISFTLKTSLCSNKALRLSDAESLSGTDCCSCSGETLKSKHGELKPERKHDHRTKRERAGRCDHVRRSENERRAPKKMTTR